MNADAPPGRPLALHRRTHVIERSHRRTPYPSHGSPAARRRDARVATAGPRVSTAHPGRVALAALLLAAFLTLLLAGVARATPPAYDAAFDQHWKDGKAELASYDLVVPRYGEDHVGTAVTVIVTEPFNDALRVKSDRGGPGSFGALKLNLVEDFPTGIYDYNVMTSVFVATQPTPSPGGLAAGDVAKISYSSQEWCGQAWHQAVFRPRDHADSVRQISHSYFESEADADTRVAHPENGFAEDALILWARGLAGPVVESGQSIEIPLYRGMSVQRHGHVPANWDTATLTRDSDTQATAKVKSDAGEPHLRLHPQRRRHAHKNGAQRRLLPHPPRRRSQALLGPAQQRRRKTPERHRPPAPRPRPDVSLGRRRSPTPSLPSAAPRPLFPAPEIPPRPSPRPREGGLVDRTRLASDRECVRCTGRRGTRATERTRFRSASVQLTPKVGPFGAPAGERRRR